MLVVPDDDGPPQGLGDGVQGCQGDLFRDYLVPGPHYVDILGQFGTDSFQIL